VKRSTAVFTATLHLFNKITLLKVSLRELRIKSTLSSTFHLSPVNIQNFETRSPALSRNNSLRIKKDDTSSLQRKLSTGTRQLRDHELTYFGVSNKPTTTTTTDPKFTKSSFVHLSNSTSKSSSSTTINSSSLKSITNNVTSLLPSTVVINHQKHSTEIDQSTPDLIMHHHHQKFEASSTPELSSSEKKSLIEALDSCIDETKNLEPLYENLYQNQKVKYDRKTDLARDEKILNELTRAADEIMNVSRR
jgi:glutamyl/glutaminyl-tRNA synthetase